MSGSWWSSSGGSTWARPPRSRSCPPTTACGSGPPGAAGPGRDELARYFGSRPADRLSRRLCTNVLVTVRGADHAEATSYFTTYRVDGWTGDLQSPPAPTQVGHYEDVFRRVDGVWLLASRTTVLAFGGPTPRATGTA